MSHCIDEFRVDVVHQISGKGGLDESISVTNKSDALCGEKGIFFTFFVVYRCVYICPYIRKHDRVV